MPSARVQMREPGGRRFTLVENAATSGDAQANLVARVAITFGTVVPGTFTTSVPGEGTLTPNNTGTYSDYTIVAKNGEQETVTLNLENLNNVIANGTTGEIITPPPAALVTYLTGKGLTFVSGRQRR